MFEKKKQQGQGQRTEEQQENVPVQTSGTQARGERRERAGQSAAMERGGESPLGAYGSYASMSPFGFVRRMMEDMDRLFGDLSGRRAPEDEFLRRGLGLPRAEGGGELARMWSPEVEVFQRDGNLVVRADLPGLDQDDIRVNLDEDGLTIEGERRSEQRTEREGIYHTERSYGSFQRRIALPRGVDASSCDARFENGVLEVTMKMPEAAKRSVQIRGGQQKPAGTSEEPRRNGGQAPTSRH